jgi:uroporphyrinogen decarboxylase
VNGRERAIAAVKGGAPDRVPLFEALVDERVTRAVLASGRYADTYDFLDDNLDFVLTNTPSLLYRKRFVDESKGLFVNEWGTLRQESGQSVSMPLEGPIKSGKDLRGYKPPDPEDDFRYAELQALLKRFKGAKAVGMHLHDVFNYPYYLRGMENFLVDLVTDPPLVKELVRISVEHNVAMARKAVGMGADFILLGDDYGTATGPLFSPGAFETQLLPGLAEIVSEIKRCGAFVIKHCCGNINVLLDLIVSSGIDALHPLDQTAGMDIGAVQEKYGGRIAVIGGIDCGELLTNGSPADVEAAVRKLLAEVSSKGGHVVSSSNTIHPKVKPENLMAMFDTVKRHGRYPIRTSPATEAS